MRFFGDLKVELSSKDFLIFIREEKNFTRMVYINILCIPIILAFRMLKDYDCVTLNKQYIMMEFLG